MSSVVTIDPKNALAFSSFGEANTTFGGGFPARSILYGDRYAQLDRRESFYTCRQHNAKVYDFNGRLSNPRSTQPFISQEKSAMYIPLESRRPSAPYRLGKVIVDSFTNLIFGEGRFPEIKLDGDPVSEDFIATIAKVGKLPLKAIQARQLGGSMGSVGMSWCFHRGKPRFEVHSGKNVFIHSWEDRLDLLPRHVTECYLFYKVQWDGKAFNKQWYWFRRDWTPEWDLVFKPVFYDKDKEPWWEPDLKKSTQHNDGICHFQWIQNLPTDDIDGMPDYEGLYDQFDQIDILSSVVVRGATLNLDPTLKLKLDPDLVKHTGVRKGSDNALIVGIDGDASYMELNGSSLESGTKLVESMRRSILETAQCIIPDPHEVAAQGVSSVAIKAMFAPMIGKGEILREQYGTGIERLLEAPLTVARAKWKNSVQVTDPFGQPMMDAATGEPQMGELTLDLPPKVEKLTDEELAAAIPPAPEAPIDPATGLPVEVPQQPPQAPVQTYRLIPREPGQGGFLSLQWPAWFALTPQDQSTLVTSMQVATGGKAFLSSETAMELAADAFGIDPKREAARLADDQSAAQDQMGGMFPPMGGQVAQQDELPPGVVPHDQPPAPGQEPPEPLIPGEVP